MKKVNIVSTVIIVSIVGAVGIGTYDPTPVVYANCEVTGTHSAGGGKTSLKYYIETQNCDELWSSKSVAQSLELGSTYNFTGTGPFTWEKKVTEAQKVDTVSEPARERGLGTAR